MIAPGPRRASIRRRTKPIVATFAACNMGQPMAQRMLIALDAAGKITKTTATTLCGGSEPYCSFHGTYKLAK